ncbi:MAG: hypothetical protein JO022_19565, partial [Acidobacteriaceae bacterium]|nr:hypothetical protein [Acidobacteriaceae bacterium]
SLTTSDSHFPVPPTVWIPQGSTTAFVPVQSQPLMTATIVTVTATYGYLSANATVVLQPAITTSLQSVTVNPTIVASGSLIALTLTLSAPAGTGGLPLTLSSSDPNIVNVPSAVTMPTGWTSGTILLIANKVNNLSIVTITVTAHGVTKQVSVVVTP